MRRDTSLNEKGCSEKGSRRKGRGKREGVGERRKGWRGGWVGKGMGEESAEGDCWEGITPTLHRTVEQVGTVQILICQTTKPNTYGKVLAQESTHYSPIQTTLTWLHALLGWSQCLQQH